MRSLPRAAALRRTTTARPEPVPPPQVRVLLTPAPVTELKIEVKGPYRVQGVGSAQVFEKGDKLSPSRVAAGSKGIQIQVGNRLYPGSKLEIVPLKGSVVWVDAHAYRGSVRLHRSTSGRLSAVNHVPLEAYVASVVNGEMPADFAVEARKAQAIVARSYALSHIRTAHADAIFDLYASTRSQKYLGYQSRATDGRLLAGESEESREIVAETAGLACTYRGEVFCPYYSAVCGGRTMAGTEFFADAAPPLQSVVCQTCRPARLYRWQATLPKKTVEQRLRTHFAKQGGRLGGLRSLRLAGPVAPGRVPRFDAGDGRQTFRISGNDLRTILGTQVLYSPRFTVDFRGENLLFKGQGYGHGVGMCQWGARGLADEGLTGLQILAHYYPGSKIVGYNGRQRELPASITRNAKLSRKR